ncbi:LTXXQ motif family protein [Enhydrobacter aerosaccus]|uniref:LTXXQ motif family protein n=1 Tax=Enhydrobacter aerosaccus TaxID=225324 RepID=A0A1T4R7P0_9HYPH|nr:Spy/CpxP family protein refolding chaperone [Enhydrobacter aerosaccus]SKA12082.1 LTXXQ motif family protein [Enhydrobacter aerosaccus]
MTVRFSYPRTLATVSLVGMALAVVPVGASMAQNPTAKPPAAQAATSSQPETVEQRITQLKTALKITPDQEPKWNAVAQAMRENAAAMDKLVKEKHAKDPNMTAVQDLETYRDFTQAHLDGLKNLIPAFDALYNSMPDAQKKNADQVFMNFGPPHAKTRSQG